MTPDEKLNLIERGVNDFGGAPIEDIDWLIARVKAYQTCLGLALYYIEGDAVYAAIKEKTDKLLEDES